MSRPKKAALARKTPSKPGIVGPAILVAICAIGVTVSALSTSDHLRYRETGGAQAGVCSALVESGCEAAHSSEAAELLGVPISHLGTAFYLACASLGLLALARRRGSAGARVSAAVAPIVALAGFGASLYSVYLASLLIRSSDACPLCIVLYGVNAGLLGVGLLWWLRGVRRPPLRPVLTSGLVMVLVGGGFLAFSTPPLIEALQAPPLRGPTRIDLPLENSAEDITTSLSIAERVPSKGGSSDADELVEISDLACPHCATLHGTVSELFEERGPEALRVRFLNYPLDAACNPHVSRSVHPTACLLARAGICAQAQGYFWEFIDAIFVAAEPRFRGLAVETALRLGLNIDQFTECLDAESTARALADDVSLAHDAGIRATPTVVVNGVIFEGAISQARLRAALDETSSCGHDHRSPEGSCGGEEGN